MKFSKLLVMSALLLSSGMAQAAIVDGVRQKPVFDTSKLQTAELPTGTAMSDTTEVGTYYLYNLGSGLFFGEGNAWGTQASVAEVGNRAFFTQYKSTSETEWDGTTLLFNDFSIVKKSWKTVFFDSETAMFVDRGNQANYGWAVDQAADGKIRLHVANHATINPAFNSENHPDLFVGLDVTENAENTALSPFLAEGEGHYIDWQWVTKEDYDVFGKQLAEYNQALPLKEKLDEAKAKGIDVAEEEAVYLDETKTVAELKAAIESVTQKLYDWGMNNASVAQPADLSSKIVNASFDSNNGTGWSGTVFAFQSYTDAEHYNKTFDTYQDIKELPAGVYEIGVQAYYRAGVTVDSWKAFNDGNKNLNAALYAKVGADSLYTKIKNIFADAQDAPLGKGGTEYGENGKTQGEDATQTKFVPNDMNSASRYFAAGLYNNSVLAYVEDGNVRIGVAKKNGIGSDWFICDNFTLTFYGAGQDAAQKWFDGTCENAADITPSEGTVYSPAYINAYNQAKTSTTVSSLEEAKAKVLAISEAAAALEKNIALWKEYGKQVNKATNIVNNGGKVYNDKSDAFADCEDAVDEYKEDTRKLTLTNEQLEEKIATIVSAIADASTDIVDDDVNVDFTWQLDNPDFSLGSWDGWTREAASGGNVAVSNSCGEAWNNSKFDIYQEVPYSNVGIYEISVQGFYRNLRGANAWNAWTAGTYVHPTPVVIYMNELETPFMNIFEEKPKQDIYVDGEGKALTNIDKWADPITGDSVFFANDMQTAACCFASPSTVNEGELMYTQKAWGMVAKKGDPMRVGVKGSSSQGGDSWVIFDNFKLTYRGYAPQVVRPVILDKIAEAKAINAPMGKTQFEALNGAILAAEAAAAGDKGEPMFNALLALIDAQKAAEASIEVFKPLVAANGELEDAIADSENDEVKGEAGQLKETIDDILANNTKEDADVDGLIEQIRAMITALSIVNEGPASDLNPQDYSAAIINPQFNTGDKKGWSEAEGTSATVDATNFAAELFNQTYDFYQVVYGLPEGTYEVGVQAFYRAGEAVDDYKFIDKDSLNNAFLYATTESGTSSKALTRLAKHAQTLDDAAQLATGWVLCLNDTENNLYAAVPNNTTTASEFFTGINAETGLPYFTDVKVVVKVGADKKLKLGLKKDVAIKNDWTFFDNFTLTYYGTSSEKTVDGDPLSINGIANGKAARVEFFTISGTKASAAQRGIVIMRATDANGNVSIRKITK